MKKLISAILAILVIASMTFSAFAAPSIDKVVGVSTLSGEYIFYVFGENISENATEVGINIEGIDEDYELRYFPKDENDSFEKYLLENDKYGIGIKDSVKLGTNGTFKVAPYEIVNKEKVVGDYVTVVKSEAETADYVGLTKLFINRKAAPGFYTETPETDFYYGLETLPETAEGLPAIEIESNYGTPVKGEIEKYYGGYTVPYSVEYTNVNGNKLDKTFNIHFREFSDKVVTVAPDSAYRVHLSYFDDSAVAMMNLKDQASMNIGLNTASDTPSNQDTYIYFTYDVDAVEGYAPVSYELTGLRARYNGFDIYSYDGNLENVTFPRTEEEAQENAGMFAGFKGYNPIPEFHLFGTDKASAGTDFTVEEKGAVASTTAVKEGSNILIARSRFPKAYEHHAYIYYKQNDYQQKINVRYVEKNPVDITAFDTSLKSLKIGGVEAEGFDEATSTYYTGVEDLDTFTFDPASVVAKANIEGATVTYGEYDNKLKQLPFTVTAKDGKTKEDYTLIFKEIQKKTIAVPTGGALEYVPGTDGAAGRYQSDDSRDFIKDGTWSNTPSDGFLGSAGRTRTSYFTVSTKELGNFVLVGESSINVTPTRHDTYVFFDSEYDTFTGECRFTEIINETATILGSYVCSDSSSSELKLDEENILKIKSSLLTVKENGNIIIGLYDGNSENKSSCVLKNPSVTLSYINLEPNTDPTLSDTSMTLTVDGETPDAYDENTGTYYIGVDSLADFDYSSVSVVATANVEGAKVAYGEFDNKLKQLPLSVTAVNGDKKDYMLIFKEIAYKQVTPSITGMDYDPETKKYSTLAGRAYVKSDSPATGFMGDGKRSYASYLIISTEGLKNFALSKAAVNVNPKTYYDTYVLFSSGYSTITSACTFDEILNGAPEIGRYVCSADSTTDLLPSQNNTLVIDGSLLRINDGNIVIGIYDGDGANGETGCLYDITVNLGYINLEPNEEIADPDDTDTSVKSVTVNGNETVYYDEATKTFYYGYEPESGFDYKTCTINVETNVEGAVGFVTEPSKNPVELTVFSRDMSVTEKYYLKFKEIQTVETALTPEGYAYQTQGGVGSLAMMQAQSTATPLVNSASSADRTGYAQFDVASLGKIAACGECVLTGQVNSEGTYDFYNSIYDTFKVNDGFEEFNQGKATLLGTIDVDGKSYDAYKSLIFDGSLLKVRNGKIVLALVERFGGVDNKVKFADVSLVLSYITID